MKGKMNMKEIMNEKMIQRSLIRMAHEIIEKNKGTDDLVIIGIKTRGESIAQRLKNYIDNFEGSNIPITSIDIKYWRDDIKTVDERIPEIEVIVQDKIVILVDDVLFSGRTIRAAMDGIMYYGRAREIHLATLIDRGHRQLPIKADYVGKNVPTSTKENVVVKVREIDEIDQVLIEV